MEIRGNSSGVRRISEYVITFLSIIGLTFAFNIILFVMLLFRYHEESREYLYGGEVMRELMLTEDGYQLSDAMQAELDELDEWAILLDENGEVIWSYRKPVEIKESYSRSEIARMSKWYLEDYPVYLRVWDDRIMVMGLPRDSVWKYNVEFPLAWIAYMGKIWFWIILLEFLLIIFLGFFFTRKLSKKREQVRIEWISGISHDIRTPLSMVMGYADVLQNSENLSTEERRQMSVIRHQSMVMKELVEDLNLTSRLEYSMQALRVEKVRPEVLLREVAAAFLSDAGEGELDIDVEISPQAEEIWIQADRKLLVRAFRNLFHNSLQHSEQNGTTKIALHMWQERRWCCVSFADNGVGYSPEILSGLHDQRKRRAVQNIRGLGIVQKIILAHDGKIRFENNRQGGSFCEIRLRVSNRKTDKNKEKK